MRSDNANGRQVGGAHYRKMEIQPWDFIVANGLGFLEGNAIKYIARWREKGGVADLEKAKHYLDKLIEVESARASAPASGNVPARCDCGAFLFVDGLELRCPNCGPGWCVTRDAEHPKCAAGGCRSARVRS